MSPVRILRAWCWSMVWLLLSSVAVLAQGACSSTSTDIVFGPVDTLSSAGVDVTGTITVTCNIGIGVISTGALSIRLGPGSGGTSGGFRRMASPGTGTLLTYQLYRDASRTQVFGDLGGVGGQGVNLSGSSLLSLGSSFTLPVTVYGRVFGSQSGVIPGNYLSNYQSGLDIRIDYQFCTLLLFCTSGTIGAPFTVSASVAPDCRVSATELAFGSVGLLSAPVDATSQITVTCTANSPYQIGLGDGLHASAPLARRMQGNPGDHVSYDLYRDAARSLPWGPVNSGAAQSGTGLGTSQVFSVFGRVPAQSTPPPGTYRDTVVVTVTY